MDLGRVFQMILNMVLRRGVNMAMDRALGGGRKPRRTMTPAEDADPADVRQDAQARAVAARARQAARLTRKL